jgi:hypothetical protein
VAPDEITASTPELEGIHKEDASQELQAEWISSFVQ